MTIQGGSCCLDQRFNLRCGNRAINAKNRKSGPSKAALFEPLEQRVLFSADLPFSVISDQGNTDFENNAELTALVTRMTDLGNLPGIETVPAVNMPDVIMQDAAAPGATAPVSDASSTTEPADPHDLVELTQKPVHLIVIDAQVADPATLLSEVQVPANSVLEVLLIESGSNGIAQISAHLTSTTLSMVPNQVAAIHIVSHGSEGAIELGNTTLSADNIQDYQSELSNWQNSLTADADILIYGCDVAATADGIALLESISASCDCDVAASTDTTGSTALGGDWVLEQTIGDISSTHLFASSVSTNWNHQLAISESIHVDSTLDYPTYSPNTGDTSSITALLANKGADNQVSLREAVIAANNTPGTVELILSANTYALTVSGDGDNFARTGDLDISSSLVITGQGANNTTIDGAMADRLFEIRGTNDLTLNNLTIQGGDGANYPGGVAFVTQTASLDVQSVVFRNNSAQNAGVIYTQGNTTINDTSFINNNGGNNYGALFVEDNLTEVTNSTFSGNSVRFDGGAIGIGGGGVLNLSYSTVAQNYNVSGKGGGIYNPAGTFITSNSIIADNAARFNGPQIFGSFTSGGNNIITDATLTADPSDNFTENPNLGQLTIDPVTGQAVHPIDSTSNAHDKITASGQITDDQRGLPRILPNDIGAYELQQAQTNIPPTLSQITTLPAAFTENGSAITFNDTVVVTDIDSATIASATIEFTTNYSFPQDQLIFADQLGISGSYDDTNGILTLTGLAPAGDYQTALRSILYNNVEDNPNILDRTIAITVNDGTSDSNQITRNIQVIADDSGEMPRDLLIPGANNSPLLVNNTGTVLQVGAGIVIDNSMLLGTDVDDTAAELHYTDIVSTNGQVVTTTAPGSPITSFTQADINNATVVFVHDGRSTQNARFDFTLRDGGEDGSTTVSDTFNIEVIGALPDSYVAIEDVPLTIPGPGVLANDSVIAASATPLSGNVITNFDARTDNDSDQIWSSTIGSIDLSLKPGTSYTAAPENPIPGINAAFDFSGNNSGATTSALSSFNEINGTGKATIEGWFYFRPTPGKQIIFETGSNGDSGITLALDNEDLELHVADGSNIGTDFPSNTVNLLEWTHIAVTIDMKGGSDEVEVRVNGSKVAATSAEMADWASGPFGLGTTAGSASGNVNAGDLNAQVAHFRIHDQLLSNPEIQDNSSNPGGSSTPGAFVFDTDDSATAGTVFLNANGGFTYNTNNAFDSLNQNQTATDRFDYTYDNGSGIQQSATVEIEVAGVNDAPVLQNIEAATLSYTEGAAAVAITESLTISDLDDSLIESAVITISSGFVAIEDELVFSNPTNTANIAGSYDATTGTLTLIGTAPLADYESAIAAVEYKNSNANPATSARTFSIVVNDGDADSNTAVRALAITPDNVTATNDAPVLLTLVSAPAYFTEDANSIGVTGTLFIRDPDDALTNSATVSISTNFTQNEDQLLFADTTNITGTYDESSGTLNLSGVAPRAEYAAALNSVKYLNTSQNPTTATRTATFSVNDGDANSNTLSRDIIIAAVNDPPVTSGIEAAPAEYPENAEPIAITSTLKLTDVDDVTIDSALVAITANYNASEDILIFNNQSGITGDFISSTGELRLSGSATLTDYETALHSVRYQNSSDIPSLLTRVFEFSVNDGDVTSNTSERDLVITAVNDPPVLATIESAAAIYIEGGNPVGITGNISVSDIDDTVIESAVIHISNNHHAQEDILSFTTQPALQAISASFDAASGTLTLTGSATAENYTNAIQSINYQNTSSNPTTSTRTISISINDGDANSNTLSRDIVVTAVNGPPVTSGIEAAPAKYPENAEPITITSTLKLTDVDDVMIDSALVAITANYNASEDFLIFSNQSGITGDFISSTGELRLSGSATLTDYETALHSVRYQNSSDTPSLLTRTIGFSVNDGDVASNTSERDLVITAVNDPPVLATIESAAATYIEGGNPVGITGNISVSDIDDTAIESAVIHISNNHHAQEDILSFPTQPGLQAISASFDAASGTLTLTGSATAENYTNAIQSINYHNTSSNPTTSTRTISISINDGDANSNALTREIEIVPANSAPTLSTATSTALTFIENGAALTVLPDISITDVDNTSFTAASVRIDGNFSAIEDILSFTSVPGIVGNYGATNGELTFSGVATKADYETILQSVNYTNTSDNPITTTRVIQFSVQDGNATSDVISRSVHIEPANDAPALSNIENLAAIFIENDQPLNITGNLTIADIDSTHIDSATVSIDTNYTPGQDTLLFTDQNGISGDFNSTTGSLTLTGSATLAEYESAIHSVGYANTSDDPSTPARSIKFTVSDGVDFSNTLTREINVIKDNDAPVITSMDPSPLVYTENDPPIAISNNLSLADSDDNTLDSATVSIVANHNADEDLLTFKGLSGIVGAYDSNTGVLALSGQANIQDYQQVLQSIRYSNISNEPATSPRTIEFTISDGDSDSTPATREIIISSEPDAPKLSNIETTTLQFFENDNAKEITNTLLTSDLDDIELESATVAIAANFNASEDRLTFANQSGITGEYDSLTGVLTLTGTASLSDYESALRAVSYQNTSDDPTVQLRTIEITVFDQNNSSNPQLRQIQIVATNDAPVLSIPVPDTPTYIENAPEEAVAPSLRVTDTDNTTIDSATIQISKNYVPGDDQLVFTNQSGISGTFAANSGTLELTGSATVAEYQAALRSVGYINHSENPSALARELVFNVFDGTTHSNSTVSSVNVVAVNDAPQGSDIVLSLFEDSLHVLSIDDFGYNDPLDGDSLSAIVVTSLPGQGILALAGSPVTPGQAITAAEINAGQLTYSPNPDTFGAPYSQLEFSVVDDGTTNGSNTDPTPDQILFHVEDISDAPSGTDTVIITEGASPHVINIDDFGFSDASDNDDFVALTINSLPSTGKLTENGIELAEGDVVLAADIEAGALQYSIDSTTVSSASSDIIDTITFTVHDSGNTDNNGAFIDPTENQLTFEINLPNRTPELISQIQTVDEGSTALITTDSLTAIDADNPPASELVFTLNRTPDHGQLFLNGTALSADESFTLEHLQQNQLSYAHDGSETSQDAFEIQLTDGGDNNAPPITSTFSLTINEVIDPAPVISDETATLFFGNAFDTSKDNRLDSGATELAMEQRILNPALVLSIVTPPVHGELILGENGTFLYQHNNSNNYQDSFSYSLTNEDGVSAVATVAVTVEPPIASAFDTAPVFESSLVIPVIPETSPTTEEPTETVQAETESSEEENALREVGATETEYDFNFGTDNRNVEADLSSTAIIVESAVTEDFGPSVLLRITERVVDELGVKQHNKFNYTNLASETVKFSTTSIEILADIIPSRTVDAAENKNFVRGLDQFGQDLQEADDGTERRYRVANDSVIGVSLGTTAGVLAWTLRGGALLASAMASTPLWSSIDPFKVVGTNLSRSKLSQEDSKVESFFDDQ